MNNEQYSSPHISFGQWHSRRDKLGMTIMDAGQALGMDHNTL